MEARTAASCIGADGHQSRLELLSDRRIHRTSDLGAGRGDDLSGPVGAVGTSASDCGNRLIDDCGTQPARSYPTGTVWTAGTALEHSPCSHSLPVRELSWQPDASLCVLPTHPLGRSDGCRIRLWHILAK